MSDLPAWPLPSVDSKGEFPFALKPYLFYLLAAITRHREARVDELLQPLGLNVSRHRALAVVAMLNPCTMSELAQFSAVDRTTMTRTVDQLVAAGLVRRATPPQDRRQVLLSVTEEGRARCEEALGAIDDFSDTLLQGLDEGAMRTVARTFEAWLANLLEDRELLRRLLFQPPQGA